LEAGGEKVILTGAIYKFGNDVNTDEIIPARYLNTSDPKELASHVMEDADPQFPAKVKPGDIIVAGKNFGCGSSREHAPLAIKAAGVSCVVAGFARIFYRNALTSGDHHGMPDAAADAQTGHELRIDTSTGHISTPHSRVYIQTDSAIHAGIDRRRWIDGICQKRKDEVKLISLTVGAVVTGSGGVGILSVNGLES
jgi:3-isopropylmalate dehydratase small subunit